MAAMNKEDQNQFLIPLPNWLARFLPNLQIHRFWVEAQNRWISLRVSRKGLRIIEKKGIETVLKDINKI